MVPFIRRHWIFFLIFASIGVGLRLFFIFNFAVISGDSYIYGDIAKNLLQHGIYGLSGNGTIRSTLIRLPGYPLFLAAIFKVAGVEHYRAALFFQCFLDLATCVAVACLAWTTLTPLQRQNPESAALRESAAVVAFAIAACCPFTANYTAAPLSETWSIFLTALCFLLAARAIIARENSARSLDHWLTCGFAIAASIMFRPDNGLLLAVVGGYVLWQILFSSKKLLHFQAGLLIVATVLLFVLPWAFRNWRTFHVFQPLAPRYANDPGEFVSRGFNRWTKTWIVDYNSVYDVYWHVDGDEIDPLQLPARAWDSGSAAETRRLLDEYNDSQDLTPALDAGFAQLAAERIRAKPLRYYIGLPLLRIADMWLRPRIEMLPIDENWWVFEDHEDETEATILLILINLLLLIAAAIGAWEARHIAHPGIVLVLVIFVLLRSAFLGTLENPEPRYTLECFPMVFLFSGIALARFFSPKSRQATAAGNLTS